jgi:very-short-patch-repair endonuclease
MKAIPSILKDASRELRKNMTEAEKILWWKLKAKKLWWIKFQRQSPIYLFTENSWLDRYIIPDFICSQYKLIIELDWSIHNIKEIYELDLEKEKILKSLWYKVIRFENEEVFGNIDKVLEKIMENFW